MDAAELEDRDHCRELNLFRVPETARREALRGAVRQPDLDKRIDDALSPIEAENPRLKGIRDERFARAQWPDSKPADVAIFGQEADPSTSRLAAMKLAIRGIDFNLGREAADTFTRDQFPDLRAGIVLANGSMCSSQNNDSHIRAAMVDADVAEVMIALPGQLFFNTRIPACLWFLAKGDDGQAALPGEVLFIDARRPANTISRVRCELIDEVIGRVVGTDTLAQALLAIERTPADDRAMFDPFRNAASWMRSCAGRWGWTVWAVSSDSPTLRNGSIGHPIAEYELQGADRADDGRRLLARLAQQLSEAGLRRIDPPELRRIRRFYGAHPQIREAVTPVLAALPTAQRFGEPEIRESPAGCRAAPQAGVLNGDEVPHIAPELTGSPQTVGATDLTKAEKLTANVMTAFPSRLALNGALAAAGCGDQSLRRIGRACR